MLTVINKAKDKIELFNLTLVYLQFLELRII